MNNNFERQAIKIKVNNLLIKLNDQILIVYFFMFMFKLVIVKKFSILIFLFLFSWVFLISCSETSKTSNASLDAMEELIVVWEGMAAKGKLCSTDMLEFLNESTKKTTELSKLAEVQEFSARDLIRYTGLIDRMSKALMAVGSAETDNSC